VSSEPVAAYRLQLQAGFTLHDAAALADYLAALGVSHVYLSPCLEAAPGSTHGYDVVDPRRVSGALGGEAGWAALGRATAAHGLRRLVDVVPNHVAAVAENPWWWDVLAHGPASPAARFFDVDWEGGPPPRRRRVLLPVLAEEYESVLARGDVRVERAGERLVVRVGGVVLPVCPGTAAADEAAVAALNADRDALHALLERQHWRLASWRAARGRLNYRRFFDIDGLVALRTEDPAVFAQTHALVLGWLERGEVDGLRIDHPDGLRDPEAYCRRLRDAAPEGWLLVEKILEPAEHLPPAWPVDGTTGYDFLTRVTGLFVDPRGEAALGRAYAAFTHAAADYPALVRAAKREVLADALASDVRRLVPLLDAVAREQLPSETFGEPALREAIVALAASFDVYRTYVRAEEAHVSPEDERRVADALAAARAAWPGTDQRLLMLLGEVLRLRVVGPAATDLTMRFQQLTGPVMAKGVEDTVFYRFNRLLALNEVGGAPDRFGLAPDAFHAACAETCRRTPRTLLATSTHDTKRSEDVRARLVLLSETPARWEAAVRRWAARNARRRRRAGPDHNAEWFLYQTLVGAWPIGVERATAAMEKAVREAKEHTSWTAPDAAYEAALRDFVAGALADPEFVRDLEAFVAPLVAPGRVNALAQTLLKLTAPGVPDLYQGTELWTLTLADPDNRRPVDFASRRRLLAELDRLGPEELLARADEGLPKLWVVRQALALRRRRPGLFGPAGGYRALRARGARADHVVAFVRGEGAVTVVPRLVLGLGGDFRDTVLPLPEGRWHDALSGARVAGGADVPLAALLGRFPVALLAREDG
jgi:(1->4)-alpha-D-glucan 1-alpha-D-glucosylmutase